MRASSDRLLRSSNTGVKQKAAHGIAHSVGFRGLQEIANERAIFEEQIMEARASFFRQLIALQSTQNRPEKIGTEKLRKGAAAFLAKPDEDFRGRRAFADPPSKRGAEFFGTSFPLDETHYLDNETRGNVLHETENHIQPIFRKCLGKLLDAAPLLGCGKRVEQLRQAGLLGSQDVSDLRRVLSRLEGLVASKDLISSEEEFNRLRRLQLTALMRGVLDLNGERLKLLDFVGEVIKSSGDLIESGHLILEMAGAAKSFDEPLAGCGSRGQQNDGLRLLARQLKVPVSLEFLLGDLPPLLKGGGIEDLWRERGRNLIQRGASAVIAQNVA